MADILAGDVTYAQVGSKATGVGLITRTFKVTFPGNAGRLDYPAGGIPLACEKLGFPRGIRALRVVGRTIVVGEANPVWMWDGGELTPKLLGFEQKTAAKQSAEMSTAGNDKAMILATPQVITIEVDG